MKPVDFTLHRPKSLGEAVDVLARHDGAKALAGGQSLVPLLNFRLARPDHVVDLDGVARLAELRRSAGAVSIGAMVRQRQAERSRAIGADCPLVAAALPFVAHPPIRNRGTVGGSVAHADPAAELPAVVRALDGVMHVAGPAGRSRAIPAADFFVTHLETALEPDELLVEIELPRAAPRTGVAFLEVSRRHGDYALVGVAAQLTLDPEGTVADARLCLTGVADTPWRCTAAERALMGARAGSYQRAAAEAAESARADLEPAADLHASSAYRRDVAGTLVERAVPVAAAHAAERDRRERP